MNIYELIYFTSWDYCAIVFSALTRTGVMPKYERGLYRKKEPLGLTITQYTTSEGLGATAHQESLPFANI